MEQPKQSNGAVGYLLVLLFASTIVCAYLGARVELMQEQISQQKALATVLTECKGDVQRLEREKITILDKLISQQQMLLVKAEDSIKAFGEVGGVQQGEAEGLKLLDGDPVLPEVPDEKPHRRPK